MSGFVVGYGQPNLKDIEKMFKKIDHRGPHLSGISKHKKVILAQNYLKADVGAGSESNVPFSISNETVHICYDGQLGNWQDMAEQYNILDGMFREERLLLHLYVQYGKDIFKHLNDAIFTFVISNGENLFAARDLLGIKTLFYGWKDKTLYLSSELKGLVTVTDKVFEFPPGHYMDSSGALFRFADLSGLPSVIIHRDVDRMTEDIREIINRSLKNRVDFAGPTAGLLSGGMDSSVINYLATDLYKEKFGRGAKMKTFSLGVGVSNDIMNARIMAGYLDSEHHELIIDLNHILEVLDEVIYSLESFDPSLVRSSVSNYLVSRYAKEHGIETLLSGEGGDEVFCGYSYLKAFPAGQLVERQIECLNFLHNNASLRLDRMNQCNSIKVVAPLISGELLNYSMSVPPEYKQKPEGEGKIEKWIFRKAYEGLLPDAIVWRIKQEFSQGSGSAGVMPQYFESSIGNNELEEARRKYPFIRSKEEWHYFRIFTGHFGTGHTVDTVGQWISL